MKKLSFLLMAMLFSVMSFAVEVTVTIADYATANGWVNATPYDTLTMDEVVTVTANPTTGTYNNTGKYYTSGTNWRMYQNEAPAIVVTAAEGYLLTSVTFTYESNKTGVMVDADGAQVASGTAVALDKVASATFSVSNTDASVTNGQARITAITVTYEAAAPGEPTYEVFEEDITNLVVDVDAMTISGGPSANYMVQVMLGLGDYDRNEGTYQLIPESYVSIQGTDATFVDGYVAELDAFTPSAKAVVRCVWNGMNIELHLNMSAAPMEATVVVVENATAKVGKYIIFGDTYDYNLTMTGEWLNPEDGVTYPVLVEVPVYYPGSTEPSEILSTVTVGGSGDNDPWLGFGEGTLTITTVDDVVTATGVVQNPQAGVAIDITITGKISTGHTVTILVTPEGAGTVTGAGEYEDGAEVTVTAEENDEYIFMGWYDATGELLANDYEYKFQVLEDVTLIAYYLPYLEGESTDLVIGENGLTASAELSIGKLNMNLVLGEEEEGMYWLAETTTLSIDGKAATLVYGIVYQYGEAIITEFLAEYNGELYYIAVAMVAPETGVDNIQVENVAVKMIKNGQLIINQNGREFNVQGAQL